MNLPRNMILIYKFLGRMVHFFTARFACMRIHFQSNFIRTFTNGRKKWRQFYREIAGDIQRDPFDLFKGNEIYFRSEITERDCTGKHGERKKFLTISSTPYLTIVSACLTPVNATVQMIRQELIFVSIIMIILALVLAMVISRLISKPLSQMNESAKELAKGNYDVEFHDQSSLEISELGSTLNYTARQLKRLSSFSMSLLQMCLMIFVHRLQ